MFFSSQTCSIHIDHLVASLKMCPLVEFHQLFPLYHPHLYDDAGRSSQIEKRLGQKETGDIEESVDVDRSVTFADNDSSTSQQKRRDSTAECGVLVVNCEL